MRSLILEDLDKSEKQAVSEHAVRLFMEQRVPLPAEVFDSDIEDPFLIVFAGLSGQNDVSCSIEYYPVPDGRSIHQTSRYGSYGGWRKPVVDDLVKSFYILLDNHLRKQPEKSEEWLNELGSHRYQYRFLHKLNQITAEVCEAIQGNAPIGFGFVFTRLKDFEPPEHAPVANRWQWWRHWRQVWAPAIHLKAEPLHILVENREIVFQVDTETVGRWSDWTSALKWTRDANLPPQTGQSTHVRRDLIQRYAESTQSSFCWFWRLTGYHRSSPYGKYDSFETFGQFGKTLIVKS